MSEGDSENKIVST